MRVPVADRRACGRDVRDRQVHALDRAEISREQQDIDVEPEAFLQSETFTGHADAAVNGEREFPQWRVERLGGHGGNMLWLGANGFNREAETAP